MQRNRLLLLMVGLLTACKSAEEATTTSDDGSSSFKGTAGATEPTMALPARRRVPLRHHL